MSPNEEIAVEIAKLLAAFPSQDASESPMQLRITAYFEAIAGLPLWAIRDVRVRVVQGMISDFDRRFAPTPPQFADAVRKVVAPTNPFLDARRATGQEPESPLQPRSDRVINGFEDLKQEMASRISGKKPPKWDANPEAALRQRAAANGVDYDTAMSSIPDAKPRTGSFGKLEGTR